MTMALGRLYNTSISALEAERVGRLILIQCTKFGRDWKSSVQEKYIHYTHTDYCVYNIDEKKVKLMDTE